MKPHQERVCEELGQMAARHEKLTVFLTSDTYATLPDDERAALSRQFASMGAYLQALQDRLTIWRNRGELE